jgi:hypothetical protein
MVWLVFGIPAATLLAAIALVFILVRSDRTDDVSDPAQEASQAQGREMAPGLPPP